MHFGMTSSDLLDTALALQLTEATDLLIARASALTAALREHALAHRARCGWAARTASTPSPTSGGTGSPTSRSRWRAAGTGCAARGTAVAVGKLSGPVGTYSNIDPAIEADRAWPGSGLRPADVATQVVLRDGIAEWVSVLALLATVCEAIALEVRHGQRTEVARAGRAVPAGPEGLVRDAAQEEPGPVRADLRAGADRPGPGRTR